MAVATTGRLRALTSTCPWNGQQAFDLVVLRCPKSNLPTGLLWYSGAMRIPLVRCVYQGTNSVLVHHIANIALTLLMVAHSTHLASTLWTGN
jgi:hypothetical protein